MVQVKDSYFKAPDGNRYFRRNAPAVEIGSFGEKKSPLTQANYLAVDGHIRYSYLDGKVKRQPPVTIDWSRESKTDVEAYVDYYFVVDGKVQFSHQKAKDANLQLVRFYINEIPLKNILNNDADIARNAMKDEGSDARVCSSVWVVMSAELAERFDTALSIEASGSASEGLSITASGGGSWSGSETITLSAGTVFAYGLHKVKKWKGTTIEDMEDDWHGLN